MNPTILVIEDDASMAELLRYNLEHEGFEVAYAADGEDSRKRAIRPSSC
jgi:DNA-binding response OmpR family regulator